MSAPTAVSTTPASAELLTAPELAASSATTQVDMEKVPSNDEKALNGGSDVNREISTDEKITDVENGAPEAPAQDESRLLKGRKLALVFTGMLLAVFLIALDQTILAPALPVIASKFQALESIAWIASAYFLTQTALLLLYGQALTVFDRKWTFLFAIFVFEIGSLLCGVAPNVNVLIFGRAVAGVGAAGIFVSVLSIVADVTTLEQRPRLLGLFGAVFGISAVVGPLLGGAFTDHATWRWCFYINLPVGAITVVTIFFLLGPQPPAPLNPAVEAYTRAKFERWTRGRWNPATNTLVFKLAVLDWIGAILMLGTIACLVLALQWGGITYAWSSGPMIGTFVAFAVLAILFGIWEWKFAGLSQLLPFRLFRNRTLVGACGIAFCAMALMLVSTYYLPIYYIATRGKSASNAGISILPFMIGLTLAAGVSGAIVTGTGRYWHILLFSPALICVGAGLLFSISAETSSAKLIGFQIIFAVGIGLIFQQTIIAVQADTAVPTDIPQATAAVTFTQLVGGTVWIAIGNTIFTSKLAVALAKYAPDADDIVRQSVEAIRDQPVDIQPGIKEAYAEALTYVFLIGIPLGFCCSLFALLVRNKSIKGQTLAMAG